MVFGKLSPASLWTFSLRDQRMAGPKVGKWDFIFWKENVQPKDTLINLGRTLSLAVSRMFLSYAKENANFMKFRHSLTLWARPWVTKRIRRPGTKGQRLVNSRRSSSISCGCHSLMWSWDKIRLEPTFDVRIFVWRQLLDNQEWLTIDYQGTNLRRSIQDSMDFSFLFSLNGILLCLFIPNFLI